MFRTVLAKGRAAGSTISGLVVDHQNGVACAVVPPTSAVV
jgi:hypothetical protein